MDRRTDRAMTAARVGTGALAIFVALVTLTLAPASAAATTVPDSVDTIPTTTVAQPVLTVPLVPTPSGCDPAPLPYVVFLGEVVGGDYRTTRFEVHQVRSGRLEPFAADNQIDIRYGLDTQYLDKGETYLVGAGLDPALGILVSRVTPPVQDFGGDEVIGLSETDADCVDAEDAFRTLTTGGQPIEGSISEPLLAARSRLLGAILVPLLVGFAIVFVLALLRNSSRAAAEAVRSREYRP